MEQAIKKAIEGGYTMFGIADKPLFKWWIDKSYKDHRILVGYDFALRRKDEMGNVTNQHDYVWIQAIFSDPLFWQSLGKAMGWDGARKTVHDLSCEHGDRACAVRFNKTNPRKFSGCYEANALIWQDQMHRFIDNIIEGKDAESFFTNLLK